MLLDWVIAKAAVEVQAVYAGQARYEWWLFLAASGMLASSRGHGHGAHDTRLIREATPIRVMSGEA